MESYLKRFMRELLEHKNDLNEYVNQLYTDESREDDLNAMFGALKKEGLISGGRGSVLETKLHNLLREIGLSQDKIKAIIQNVYRYWDRDKGSRTGVIHFQIDKNQI